MLQPGPGALTRVGPSELDAGKLRPRCTPYFGRLLGAAEDNAPVHAATGSCVSHESSSTGLYFLMVYSAPADFKACSTCSPAT